MNRRTRESLHAPTLVLTAETPAYIGAGIGRDFPPIRPMCATCNERPVVDVGKTRSTECGLCLASSIDDDKKYARNTL